MGRQRRFPYRIAVEFSKEDEAYIARVPVLPGCAAHGDTAEDATREVLDAADGILSSMKRHGEAPPPSDLDRGHSGNLRLRLPRYLHARLARRADVEGVSLNQLMVALLAEQGSAPRAPAPVRGTHPAELVEALPRTPRAPRGSVANVLAKLRRKTGQRQTAWRPG